jgi:hypothetical protein
LLKDFHHGRTVPYNPQVTHNAQRTCLMLNWKVEDAAAMLASGFEATQKAMGRLSSGSHPLPARWSAVIERSTKIRNGVEKVSGGIALVPDIRGLTIRRVIKVWLQRLDAVVIGTGTVIDNHLAGERLARGQA